MDDRARQAIARRAGSEVAAVAALSGGQIARVLGVDLADGRRLVAKLGDAGSGLETEGAMLRYLAEQTALPVPEVIHCDARMLLMTRIAASGRLDAAAERDAADAIAALHDITSARFGFDFDTVIGGLHQPNPRSETWLEFFRDHRLLHMGRVAHAAGALPAAAMARIETLAGRLGDFLPETSTPSLIHGDLWGGNVLCGNGRIAGFIDPAIYFADAEIELAFATLFATFGDAFFARYRERRGLAPGFFEERRGLYNLYPLLVHVRLFGGPYIGQVEASLRRLGF